MVSWTDPEEFIQSQLLLHMENNEVKKTGAQDSFIQVPSYTI